MIESRWNVNRELQVTETPHAISAVQPRIDVHIHTLDRN